MERKLAQKVAQKEMRKIALKEAKDKKKRVKREKNKTFLVAQLDDGKMETDSSASEREDPNQNQTETSLVTRLTALSAGGRQ